MAAPARPELSPDFGDSADQYLMSGASKGREHQVNLWLSPVFGSIKKHNAAHPTVRGASRSARTKDNSAATPASAAKAIKLAAAPRTRTCAGTPSVA
jgi:hypothetical protein